MSSSEVKPVVVGIDGSPSALDAACWAAAEAARRGTWLQIVFADVFAQVYIPELPTIPLPETYSDAMARQARTWLDRAEQAARSAAPDIEVRTVSHTGSAAPVLIDESQRAQLVVVGSRGLGGYTGLIVGSVAVALCAHGHCPVAVVRQSPADVDPAAPVVVGVDDRDHQEPVLTAAFDAAAMRSVLLVAVHAWHEVGSRRAWKEFHAAGQSAAVHAEEERFLAEALAGWTDKYPDVAVRRVVVHGQPARALLDHAEHAQLVVAGSRGRGGFAGLLLGSTSQQLVHHASCSVLVVR
ncbi:universal stress protein [Saccharopolyspora indica]|uniref:universal stress protein n=1 Tax=Saccharopolyspora indica TaxID=1229659 RepID=UPI0022EAC82B|nr:universal stress protein [Saccharopolyspora indica]MDA3644285.1 universal stress protein [Saccharopolyspora indica]